MDPLVDPLPLRGAGPRPRVAVVGSGVAGLVAGYLLSGRADVTLYEADARLGGHAHTQQVEVDGHPVAVDTGFIVHNDRTYPTLVRLFAELGIETQETQMSMSVRCDETGLEYAGARGLGGLFAQPRALARPAYLLMLAEVARFHRRARTVLALPETHAGAGETLEVFLDRGGFSAFFRDHFMTPVVAAVWSTAPGVALEFPARYLFAFLEHHGMLTVFGSPTWRTVVGGSQRYVERVAAALHEVRCSSPVTGLSETPDGVEITVGRGTTARYDAAVVATHPHQALAILASPSTVQRDVLGAMTYSVNLAQLHTDTSLLPRAERARASWNYLRRPERDDVVVSYDLTRLQRLDRAASGARLILTLGAPDLVDPATVLSTTIYEHPRYTPEFVAAQRSLPLIDTGRVVFAGAYHGWGFHEDGAASGARAAARLGAGWPEPVSAGGHEARPSAHSDAVVATGHGATA
ncbi:MAG TPA: FAD-dependent oxidoreductase [Candidatus Lustribacter sp.]|nr:FAD-dependent oxidoreductase [Candidatus Lustribacter sp.]